MKINNISSLIIILCLFGCSSIQPELMPTFTPIPTNTLQPITTAEPFSTLTVTPENATEITTTAKDNQTILKGFQGYVFWLAWSKDGNRLLIGTEKSGVIIYNLAQKKVIANFYQDLPTDLVMQNLALSPDGNILAVVIYSEHSIHLINPETGDLIKTLDLNYCCPRGLSFSVDNKVLASSTDKEIILWDITTGKEIKKLFTDNYPTGKIWFTPDGKSLIARFGQDHTFRIWNTNTWELQKTLQLEFLGNISFSPDGNKFATIGPEFDAKVSVWDFQSGEKLFNLNGAQLWARAIDYDPSGKYIAVGGSGGDDTIIHKITVWDANTGKYVRDLITGYYVATNILAFSPDGTKLASGGNAPEDITKSEVIIWDMTHP
jgi:WD40 repeat protein